MAQIEMYVQKELKLNGYQWNNFIELRQLIKDHVTSKEIEGEEVFFIDGVKFLTRKVK